MLKGKALKDFEEWYKTQYYPLATVGSIFIDTKILRLESLELTPLEGKMGYYLEFFREKEIDIYVSYDEDGGYYYSLNNDRVYHYPDYNTAFTHAIDKACELWRGE